MKKIIYIILFIPFILASCVHDEEDIFGKSAALRMEEEIQADIALLTGAEKGWLTEYYPEKGHAIGGYAMYWKFNKESGTVDVVCEADVDTIPAFTAASSLWDMKRDQGPVLVFDLYNPILHYFCTPVQTDVTGLDGDYEFVIRRNIVIENYLVMFGKRNGNQVILRPVKEDEDPIAYLRSVRNRAENVATAAHKDFYVTLNGDSIGSATVLEKPALWPAGLNWPYRGMTINYNDTITKIINEETGESELQLVAKTQLVSYTFTPEGVHLYEPFKFDGLSVTEARKFEADAAYKVTRTTITIDDQYLELDSTTVGSGQKYIFSDKGKVVKFTER
jgi:hypothetical protein